MTWENLENIKKPVAKDHILYGFIYTENLKCADLYRLKVG